MTKPANNLAVIHNNLNNLITSKQNALPKDFNATRFIQNSMTVLQSIKDIQNIEPISVARCILKGAFLGLDFLNKECYAIPYGKEINFQTDYKGEKKLAKKYSLNPIKDIYAKLVRQGDVFEEVVTEGRQVVNFNPISFNDDKIIGAFAVCYYADDSMIYETMSVKEMEDVRKNYSKMKEGKAWTKSTGQMYLKTVLRRLCKHIELEFDSVEQKQNFDESSDFSFEKESLDVTELQKPVSTKELPEPEKVVDDKPESLEEGEIELDVFEVGTQSGKKGNGSAYTMWIVSAPAGKYTTFSKSFGEILTNAQSSKETVMINFKQGKYGNEITNVEVVS